MKKGFCISSDVSTDSFVGIRFDDDLPHVVFPHGYHISDDETEQRKDVFRLLAVLKRFSTSYEGDGIQKNGNIHMLPISSYQFLIQDFLTNGYYVEKEVRFVEALKGKTSWKRTIQKEKPQVDDSNIVYLKYQIKTNQIKSDALITKIHQYCVYLSFAKFGWLYFSSEYLPAKPLIEFNRKLFLNVLKSELNNTFNDNKRQLFQSMINIIMDTNEDVNINNVAIGVKKFEGVWERLVDYVFGEVDKDKYFPHATWYIINDNMIEQSSALEPDTVMKWNGKIYVLDAKYYRYGISRVPTDLPPTASIQKQITYGKHIFTHSAEFDASPAEDVYNAFIMPSDSPENEYEFVSVGTADWDKYDKSSHNFQYVLGILVDTKSLISNYTKHNESEIERLADLIECSLKKYRDLTE